MDRRQFLTGVAGSALAFAAEAPTRAAKVERLFKSPEGFPNALEATPQGLWLSEQISDAAYLVDWNGKVLQKVETESSNSSGIAFGGGFLWMAANGKSMNRPAKGTDARGEDGIIVKVDPKTGKTVARFPIPGGGGVHGLEYVNGSLWVAFVKAEKLVELNANDFSQRREIKVHMPRPHGIAVDSGAVWVVHTGARTIHKLNASTGAIMETITVRKEDPEPHGMCLYRGQLYIADAGIGPDGSKTGSPHTGWICRIV
jgi:hypothetical protein